MEMKKKIIEVFKDPYRWGCAACGWITVEVAKNMSESMGSVVIVLVFTTGWMMQRITERDCEKKMLKAIEKGLIRVCNEEED
jgi:metal-sulfur cluster biosynthetic enzyme